MSQANQFCWRVHQVLCRFTTETKLQSVLFSCDYLKKKKKSFSPSAQHKLHSISGTSLSLRVYVPGVEPSCWDLDVESGLMTSVRAEHHLTPDL